MKKLFLVIALIGTFSSAYADGSLNYGATKAAGRYDKNAATYRVAPLPANDKTYAGSVFSSIDQMSSQSSSGTNRSSVSQRRDANFAITTTVPPGPAVKASGNSITLIAPNPRRVHTPSGSVTVTPGTNHSPTVVIQDNRMGSRR